MLFTYAPSAASKAPKHMKKSQLVPGMKVAVKRPTTRVNVRGNVRNVRSIRGVYQAVFITGDGYTWNQTTKRFEPTGRKARGKVWIAVLGGPIGYLKWQPMEVKISDVRATWEEYEKYKEGNFRFGEKRRLDLLFNLG